MKEKTKEMADQVGAVYPTLFFGRHDGVLFTETELETFVELVAAAELRRLHEVNQELLEALGTIRDLYEYDTSCGELASRLYDARSISIFAIAKAEREMK